LFRFDGCCTQSHRHEKRREEKTRRRTMCVFFLCVDEAA
jgi:hypothetical protein